MEKKTYSTPRVFMDFRQSLGLPKKETESKKDQFRHWYDWLMRAVGPVYSQPYLGTFLGGTSLE